jgi:peptidoglycan hydrolase-like protein with peptidoglycan-binding domain
MTTSVRRSTALLAPVALLAGLLVAAPAEAAPDQARAAKAECRRTLADYPELDPGDRDPAVRTLQCAINDLGLGPVVVDGYYGPETKKALTPIVMAREGQPPHPYRLTPLFWHQLYGLQLPHRTLREGDHGRDVRNLQRALRAFGVEVVVDGDFGPQTTSAVKEYQKVHGIPETGRTDRSTRFYLVGGDYF